VISWAITLVVIRLLAPGDYGLMAMVNVIIGLLAMVAEMGFGASLVQSATLDRSRVRDLFGVALLLNLLFMGGLMAAAPLVAGFYGEPRLTTVMQVACLQFALNAEPGIETLRCPPMTLMTLVENAVRHGIDPSEEGGRIDVRVRLQDARCRVEVVDTGVGLGRSAAGLGTGLTNLRERLQLAFGGDATLTLTALEPHGVSAELDFPARRNPP